MDMDIQEVTPIRDKIEYKKISGINPINKFYEMKVINGLSSDYRRCITCKKEIKCANSNTTGLHKHRESCKKRPAPDTSAVLKFPRRSLPTVGKGLEHAARLVYNDNIAISKVVKSDTLQFMYSQLKFDTVSYYSVNQALNDNYQTVVRAIKHLLNERDKNDLMCISFDKWTSADQKRYLGVYLYVASKSICLGMINYRGFCGGEETLAHLKHLLEIFDLVPNDIHLCVVDCGADVQLGSRLANWYTFPCLCHIINLIAKKLLFNENACLQDDSILKPPGRH